MPLYQLLLDAKDFHGRITPALSASWRQRSFVPCRQLAGEVLPLARDFATRYRLGNDVLMLTEVADEGPFDSGRWRRLVSELLWYCAREIPEMESSPEMLACLCGDKRAKTGTGPRGDWSPAEQAHYGTRDLHFGGGYYRPDRCAWNDQSDVDRLVAFLDDLRPETWKTADLAGITDLETEEDREEELAFVRDWLPNLQCLYRQAARDEMVVVCEQL